MSTANFLLVNSGAVLGGSSYNSLYVPFNNVYITGGIVTGILDEGFTNGFTVNDTGYYYMIYTLTLNNNFNESDLQSQFQVNLKYYYNTTALPGSNFYVSCGSSAASQPKFSYQITGQWFGLLNAGESLALYTFGGTNPAFGLVQNTTENILASLYIIKINSTPFLQLVNYSIDNGSSVTASMWATLGNNVFYNDSVTSGSPYPLVSSFESNPDFTLSSWWAPNGENLITVNNVGVYMFFYTVNYYDTNNQLVYLITASTSVCSESGCSATNYPNDVYNSAALPYFNSFGIIKNWGTILENTVFTGGVIGSANQWKTKTSCVSDTSSNNGCAADLGGTNIKQDFSISYNTYYQLIGQGLLYANPGDVIYPINLGSFVDSNNNVGTYLANEPNSNIQYTTNNATLSLLKIPNGNFYSQVVSKGSISVGTFDLLPLQGFATDPSTGTVLNNGFFIDNNTLRANSTTGGAFLIMFSVTVVQNTPPSSVYNTPFVNLNVVTEGTTITLTYTNQFEFFQNNTFTVNGQYTVYVDPNSSIYLLNNGLAEFLTASTPTSSTLQENLAPPQIPVAISLTLVQLNNM
jgi:hypothetical protein